MAPNEHRIVGERNVRRGEFSRQIVSAVALLALFGATLLLSLGVYVWDAFLILGLSFITLLSIMRRYWKRRLPPAVRRLCLGWFPHTLEGWLRVFALIASALAMVLARSVTDNGSYVVPLLIWIVGIGVYILPLLISLLRASAIHPPMLRWEWGALILLIAVAAALRGVRLGRIPYNLGGDEGTQLVIGLDLLNKPLGNPFATGWYSVPTMSFFSYGLVMRILGATIAGGRALSVIMGVTTVVLTFFLGRMVGGRRIGWWSAIVLAVSAYHIHYSRLASNQIADPWVGALAFGLLWLGYDAGDDRRLRRAAWGLAGVVAGLGWYGYFGARWVTILMGLFLLWRMLVDPAFLYRHRHAVGLLIVGGLIALLPLLGWYQVHPSALTERYQAVSIFSSGWLSREQVLTGRSAVFLMGQQLWRAFTAFHLTPDPTFWYRPGRPLLDFVTSGLLLIGISAAVLRARWPSRGLMLLWFVTTVLTAWGITENPPSSQRGLLLMPVVSVLVAWGLREVLRALTLKTSIHRWLVYGILTAIVILNVGFYFAVYTPRRVYGNPTSEVATAIGRYLRENPSPVCTQGPSRICEGRVYFLGAPSLYWEFGGLQFLARGIPGEDVLPDQRPSSVILPARFVVTSYRIDDLSWIESVYPQGTRTSLHSPDGRLLAIVYDWPAPQ